MENYPGINKDKMELIKLLIEQNGIILLLNKLLLEQLAAPVWMIKSKAK